METKAITTLFTERGTVVCPAATVNGKLHGIESLFEGCDSKLAGAEMSGCGYDSQRDAINTMTENMRQLSLYAATAHERVSEELDQPLYEHFKKNATETITAIKLSEITTDNTFGLAEYVEIERQGQHIRYKRAKANLTMEDFLGIQEITAEDGTPILENVETVSEFASLFRKDYDTMTKKDMSLDEYLEWYADSGDASHKGYHPVADMISGIADIIILKPMIECIIGKDIITGEYLTEEELDWKTAGICIDLITLGMGSKVLAGAKSLKEILKISGKTLVVDALSATATYSTAYIGEELGLSEESIFILSLIAGGSVSYASGKVLLKNADEVVKGGTDVLNEIKKIDEIEVEFNYNSKYDETEFARQLADQQKGMNELTVQEYLDNRQKYIEQGRAIESNAAQQVAREKAFVDKVDELQDAGLSLKEAEEQAQKWLDTQAALHNPDQVAGGFASNVGGVGDKGVNSSIGSQWRYRIDDVDAQIQKMAESMSEAEKNSTYLNVNLIYKGD